MIARPLLFLVFLLGLCGVASASEVLPDQAGPQLAQQAPTGKPLTDQEIRKLLIQQSLRSYRGSCLCPL